MQNFFYRNKQWVKTDEAFVPDLHAENCSQELRAAGWSPTVYPVTHNTDDACAFLRISAHQRLGKPEDKFMPPSFPILFDIEVCDATVAHVGVETITDLISFLNEVRGATSVSNDALGRLLVEATDLSKVRKNVLGLDDLGHSPVG